MLSYVLWVAELLLRGSNLTQEVKLPLWVKIKLSSLMTQLVNLRAHSNQMFRYL